MTSFGAGRQASRASFFLIPRSLKSLPFQESPFLSEPEDSSLCCLEAEGGWGLWKAGLWMGGDQRVPPAWPCLRDGNTRCKECGWRNRGAGFSHLMLCFNSFELKRPRLWLVASTLDSVVGATFCLLLLSPSPGALSRRGRLLEALPCFHWTLGPC